mmetsp:Transcript_79424/g.233388  ORF Transcript_79424/g.233388 Transcript_79424/m.233388 type:complete len:276 (+) Transcript_79424:647-1474(+)
MDLADRPIFSSNVQRVGLVLREGQGRHREVAHLLRLILEIDRLLQCHIQHRQRPDAEAAVVRGRDQVRGVLRAHLLHGLHGMRVALAAEGRAQHRQGLSPCIPEHDATSIGATEEDRRVEAVEVRSEHGARARERELGPVLHGQVPDTHAAVWVRERRVGAAAVGREEHLTLVRGEPHVRHGPAPSPLLLDVVVHKLHLLAVLSLVPDALAAAEVGCEVPRLLAQRPLHHQRRALEELVEVWVVHDVFPLLGAQLLGRRHLRLGGRRLLGLDLGL